MARTRLWRQSGSALTAVAVIGICFAAPATADPELALHFDIGTNGEQIATVAKYRIACARRIWASGEHLELTVAPINPDGTLGEAVSISSEVRAVGNTSFNRGTPLSVGGKLTPGPTIDAASDQFNGWIDNAFFRDF